MKEVMAIVRINMMNQTKRALTDAGIDAFYAHEVQGRGQGLVNTKLLQGAQEGYEEAAALLGSKGQLYPKRLLTVVVKDKQVPAVVKALVSVNQTGKPGDGKIFVLPLANSVRVRTGETAEKALS